MSNCLRNICESQDCAWKKKSEFWTPYFKPGVTKTDCIYYLPDCTYTSLGKLLRSAAKRGQCRWDAYLNLLVNGPWREPYYSNERETLLEGKQKVSNCFFVLMSWHPLLCTGLIRLPRLKTQTPYQFQSKMQVLTARIFQRRIKRQFAHAGDVLAINPWCLHSQAAARERNCSHTWYHSRARQRSEWWNNKHGDTRGGYHFVEPQDYGTKSDSCTIVQSMLSP